MLKETIGVALRVIFTALLSGRKLLILDESFGGVDKDREYNVGKFLSEICREFDIQLVIVSHKLIIAEFADKKIEV